MSDLEILDTVEFLAFLVTRGIESSPIVANPIDSNPDRIQPKEGSLNCNIRSHGFGLDSIWVGNNRFTYRKGPLITTSAQID